MPRLFYGVLGAILWKVLSLGSPIIGFLLGYLISAAFPSSHASTRYRYHFNAKHSPQQTIFFECVFSVMGFIAKQDGNISKADINTAEFWMQHFKLTDEHRKEAIKAYQAGKSSRFDLASTLQRLKLIAPFQPAILDTFIHIQIQAIMRSDGAISAKKQKLITTICQILNRPIPFMSHQRQRQYQQHDMQLGEAYQLLGVKATASDTAIKSAYRKLRGQYHPDKLIAQGVPQEMIKSSEEQFQNVKKAYEAICRHRKQQ